MLPLSSEQQDAFEVVKSGKSLVVNATAGSGKTSWAQHVGQWAVASGMEVFGLSFSNIGVNELNLVGATNVTTTKLGYAILGDYFWSKRNTKRGRAFKKAKGFDKYTYICRSILKEEGYDKKEVNEILELGLRKMVDLVRLDLAATHEEYTEVWYRHFATAYPQDFTGLLDSILQDGIDRFERNNSTDYTDCLWLPNVLDVKLFGFKYNFPKSPDLMILDECQDFSMAEVQMMLKYYNELDTQLVWIGDIAQAIYSFKGASGEVFETIAEVCEERNLTKTFRCPKLHTEFIRQTTVGYGDEIPEQPLEANIFSAKDEDGILVEYDQLEETLQHIVPGNTLFAGRNIKGNQGKILQALQWLIENTDYTVALEGFNIEKLTRRLLDAIDDNRLTIDQVEVGINIIIEEEITKMDESTKGYFCDLKELSEEMRFAALLIGLCTDCNTVSEVRYFIKHNLNSESADVKFSTIFRSKGMTYSCVVVLEDGPMFDDRSTTYLNKAEIPVYFVMVSRSNNVMCVPRQL